MIIKATPTCPAYIDLSSLERLQEENTQEAKAFRLTLRRGQTVTVDDQWYVLVNIQASLKAGYIEILDYKQQNVFVQEIKIPESHTPNFNLTKVEILNRADYPQDAFEKINAAMDIIDANMGGSGGGTWGTITGDIQVQTDLQFEFQTKANVSGQAFSGNVSATNLTGFNSGDQDLSNLVTKDTTVNGYALSSNVSVNAYDVGLGAVANADTTTTSNINDSTDKRFVTDNYLLVLANTSGINTGFNSGDQDLSNLVTKDTTVNGYALSSNVSVNAYDVGLGAVANADTTTTSNINDSTDKRFVTDNYLLVLANTSGINTGNQDLSGLLLTDQTIQQTTVGTFSFPVVVANTYQQSSNVGITYAKKLRFTDEDGGIIEGYLRGGIICSS